MPQGKGLSALKRSFRTHRRAWQIAAVAGGVVALALVVFVSSLLSTPSKSASPELQAMQTEMESNSLTEQGLAALSSNDTATAQALLQRAVTLNPKNTRAAVALTRVRQSTSGSQSGGSASGGSGSSSSNGGGGSGGGSSTGGTTNEPGAAGPFDRQVDIARLLPVMASGFKLDIPIVSGPEAEVIGEPSMRGVRVLWAVHDRGTSAKAKAFISGTSKDLYGKDSGTASIDGATAYLGTDGSRYATAVYARGRYVFEVIVSLNQPSATVKDVLPIAKDAAAAFPDTP